MKKGILMAFIAIVLIGGVLMLLKKEVKVTRSITIDAPIEKVSEQITHFKNFVKWSPWADIDPKMEKIFSGEDGKVGAKYAWSGNDEVGIGSQEMVSISKERIVTKLVFEKPFESESEVYYELSEQENKTNINWGYKGEMAMLMTLFIDMDDMLGTMYEKGLANLKSVCENK